MNPDSVILQHIERDDLVSSLVASLDGDGGLVLDGRDAGRAVDLNHGSEHRYRITLAQDRVEAFAAALHEELHDGRNGPDGILVLLRTAFVTGRFSSAHDLMHWMSRSGFPSELETI